MTKGFTPYPGSGVALSNSSAGAAIKCEGTVTDTYTWEPDGSILDDPPPTKVLVHEATDVSYDAVGSAGTCSGTATTGMPGETGAGNDQQDDGNPSHPGMAKGSRHGERWRVIDGGPTVTVTSPQMSVSCAGSSRAQVTRNFTSTVAEIYVTFSCIDTNTSKNAVWGKFGAQRCLVGMGITAGVTITPDAPPTYTAPGATVPFKDYDISKANDDQLTALDGTFALVPHFFNADKGKASVTCTGKTHGVDFTVTNDLTVERPDNLVWTATAGQVLKSTDRYGVYGNSNVVPNIVNGMDWDANLALPSGFSGATLTFTQKATLTRDEYYKPGQPVAHKVNQYHGKPGLDRDFTYFGTFSPPHGHGGDNPVQPYNNNLSSSVSSDSFEVWLMFKPAVSDAAWVPLQTHTWSWNAKVEWQNSVYVLTVTQAPQDATPTDTSSHPQWNFVVPSPQAMVPAAP